jgi:hypothetical protein
MRAVDGPLQLPAGYPPPGANPPAVAVQHDAENHQPGAPAQLTDAQQRAIPGKLHDNTIHSFDNSLTILLGLV